MTWYISGPMSGHEGLNFSAFEKAATELRKSGYLVVSPHEMNPALDADWFECIVEDIKAVKECTGIYMLQGWEDSPGANIEWWTAKKYGLNIAYEQEQFQLFEGWDF